MSDDVQHNLERGRYELVREGRTAYAEYERRGDIIVATHTVTPPALRGQGIAGRLVKAMLADARREGLKVAPQCSYVAAYFESHPEEQDLRAN